MFLEDEEIMVEWMEDLEGDLSSVKKQTEEEFPQLFQYLWNPRRSAALNLLSPLIYRDDTMMLDIGAGFGSVGLQLASRTREIYALEQDPERIKVMEKLIQLHQAQNVIPIQESMHEFQLGTIFDVVLLNGVLEWAGHKSDHFAPREAQKNLLRRARAVMKSDGVLVIGIENRFSPLYLKTPDHNGLKYTSYMPRKLADWWSRAILDEPYDTYTYTANGYEKLLREVGFSQIKIMGCFPNYRYPKLVYSFEPCVLQVIRDHLVRSKKQDLFFWLMKHGLAKWLSPSFIIFAGFIDPMPIHGNLMYSGSGGASKIFSIHNDHNGSVLTVFPDIHKNPMSDEMEKAMAVNDHWVSFYKERAVIKKPLLKMKPLYKWKGKKRLEAMYEVHKLLETWKRGNRRTVDVKEYLQSLGVEKHFLLRDLWGELTLEPVHGDLIMGNILFNGTYVHILDFEHIGEASVFYDWMLFLKIAAKREGGKHYRDFYLSHYSTQKNYNNLGAAVDSLILKQVRHNRIHPMLTREQIKLLTDAEQRALRGDTIWGYSLL